MYPTHYMSMNIYTKSSSLLTIEPWIRFDTGDADRCSGSILFGNIDSGCICTVKIGSHGIRFVHSKSSRIKVESIGDYLLTNGIQYNGPGNDNAAEDCLLAIELAY